jgi:predicted transporter
MSNRAINAIGVLLGAIAVGIPMGIYAARKWRCDEPADTTNPQAVATSISNVKGAR